MAGHRPSKVAESDKTKGRHYDPPNQRTSRRRQKRREVFRELVQIAADQGHPIVLGVSTADALQGCLDRAVALFRFAADRVDSLQEDDLYTVITSPNGSTSEQPHRWLRMEAEMRAEIEHLAGMMTSLGIAERTVRIQEAQAALLIASIRDAALEAGISHDQVRALGAALRARVDDATTSISPTPKEASSARQSQSSATGAAVGSLGPGHGAS